MENDKLITQETSKGLGVFAKAPYAAGERIFKFGGPLMKNEEVPEIKEDFSNDHYIAISDGYSLGPSGDFDDIFNHSCDPNAGLITTADGIFLTAIKDIAVGEEICFDYSTTLEKDDFNLPCKCGAKTCRHIINSFGGLSPELRQHYLDLNIVMPFIAEKYR